jgi:hypothetical protein
MYLKYKLFPLLVIAIAIQVRAQGGLLYGELLQAPAWTARSAGMGNTGLAVSDPGATGYLNPAASAWLRRIQATVSVQSQTASMFSMQNKSNPSHIYQMQPATQNALNVAGFNLPVQYHKHPVVVGLHLRNWADMQTRFLWKSMHTDSDEYTETEIKRDGALYGLSARLASLLSSSFSIGVQVSLLGGHQKTDTTYTVHEQNSRAFARTQWQNRFAGYVFEFGYLWRISTRWAIGQNFVLPYTQKLKEIEMNNISLQRSYSTELSMRVPAQVWTGITWHMHANLMASVDYHFRPWEKVQFEGTAPLHFSDAHTIHTGLEYRLPINHSVIPLRLGWHNQPKQVYEYDSTNPGKDGKQIISSSISGGFGMYLGSLQIDVAVDMERYTYPTQWYIIGEKPVNIRQTRYHFMVTFLYLL